jgi:hypothetical protein
VAPVQASHTLGGSKSHSYSDCQPVMAHSVLTDSNSHLQSRPTQDGMLDFTEQLLKSNTSSLKEQYFNDKEETSLKIL